MVLFLAINGLSWLSTRPSNYWEQMWVEQRQASAVSFLPDFQVSGTLVLTDCYLLNHWWLALCMLKGFNIFSWLQLQQDQSSLATVLLLKAVQIWFGKQPRKPPDKSSLNFTSTQPSTTYKSSIYNFIMNRITELLIVIEDALYHLFSINIDLSHCLNIATSIIIDYCFELLAIVLAINFNYISNDAEGEKWSIPDPNEVPIIEMNVKDPFYFVRGRRVLSKVVLSMSAKSKRSEIDNSLSLDTDSYLFAIDTCTSENICKHKELFVGAIKPFKNLYVQGVGGKIKASGYGSIKVRVTDDDGKLHDLLIHNVIYLPESPVNLLSPQKWSIGSNNPTGTGEITAGKATLLFWNDTKTTKYIPHHPELGIPIMSVNDGYTKSSEFLHASQMSMFCQPCSDSIMLQTSTVIDDTDKVNMIPFDDENDAIEPLHVKQRGYLVD